MPQSEPAATNATGELLPRGLKHGVFGLFFSECVCTELCVTVTIPLPDGVNVSGPYGSTVSGLWKKKTVEKEALLGDFGGFEHSKMNIIIVFYDDRA